MTLLFGTFMLVKVFDIVNSSIYVVSFTENQLLIGKSLTSPLCFFAIS